MKKLSVILAISLGLAACAEKDSDYARKYRNKTGDKAKTEQVVPGARSAPICETPEINICEKSVLPIVADIKKNGLEAAVKALKAELSLPEEFDGTEESFKKLITDGAKRIKAQNRLLVLADKEYRTIYNYDEDVKEATEIVRKLMIEFVNSEKLENGRMDLVGALNTTAVQSVSETFENSYQGKDLVTIDMAVGCGADGLNVMARSLLPGGGPSGVIFICPGQLLLNAGKTKTERIAGLVMTLAHEMTHQLEYRGFELENRVLSCVNSDLADKSAKFIESKNKETQADIIGFRILNKFLAQDKELSVQTEKAKAALSWMCHLDDKGNESDSSTHLDNKSRLKNFFKLKETEDLLGCSKGPRC
ncbi:hypothetical protein ACNH6C_02275 [Bdellovibrio bacteriovorus]|uniref:hypothetical protein n=1 Tax=Bdellovibrio bacteriovorus TaxID=959 RepID=UPI003A7FA19E